MAGLSELTDLSLANNYLRELGSLAELRQLRWLDLSSNWIRDAGPLVENTGLGNGDTVDLSLTELNPRMHLGIHELRNRGVEIKPGIQHGDTLQ